MILIITQEESKFKLHIRGSRSLIFHFIAFVSFCVIFQVVSPFKEVINKTHAKVVVH